MSNTIISTQQVDQSCWNANQSWHWHEIRRYATWNGTDVLLRANIRLNCYSAQSHANIELFSTQQGWVTVAQHPVSDFACRGVHWTTKSIDAEQHAALTATSEALFAIGEKALGISY